jgi:hypothetical protein
MNSSSAAVYAAIRATMPTEAKARVHVNAAKLTLMRST